MNRYVLCLSAALLAVILSGCAPRVAEGKSVQVRYTGRLADGTVFDSTESREPLEITIGSGFWIPALEQALIGMKAGDKKRIEVKATEAFGEYNPLFVEEVEKSKFPDGVRFEEGMTVQTMSSKGPTLATVIEVRPKTVMIDHNHPFAGKDLFFDVEVLKIRSPSRE